MGRVEALDDGREGLVSCPGCAERGAFVAGRNGVEEETMISKKVHLHELPDHHHARHLSHRVRHLDRPVPKYQLQEEPMPADVVYRLIHDEMNLDGNPTLNLASFVTTWMEPEAEKLIGETLNKNFVNQEEYPQTTEIQSRCVNILARLFGAPLHHTSVGTSTIGSSEAIHLAGLAMKWNHRKRMEQRGRAPPRRTS